MDQAICQPAAAGFSTSSLIASRQDELQRAIEVEEDSEQYETVWVAGAPVHTKIVPDPFSDSELSELEDHQGHITRDGYITPESGWETEDPWDAPPLHEHPATRPTAQASNPHALPSPDPPLHPSPLPSPRSPFPGLLPLPSSATPASFLRRQGSFTPSVSSYGTGDENEDGGGSSGRRSRSSFRTSRRRLRRGKRGHSPEPTAPSSMEPRAPDSDSDSDIDRREPSATSNRSNRPPGPPQGKRLRRKSTVYTTEANAAELPHSRQGYIGASTGPSAPSTLPQHSLAAPDGASLDPRLVRMAQLTAEGYTVVKASDAPTLFTDKEQRISAWRMGVPTKDPKAWSDRVTRLQRGVDALHEELDLHSKQPPKKKEETKKKAGSPRGDFICAHFGYSYGGGQKAPRGFRQTSRRKRRAWARFLKRKAVRLTIGLINRSFETWAPRLYKLYSETHAKVTDHYGLQEHTIGGGCPFAAITVNFGPRVVCFQHRDLKNLSFGGCPIVVLGTFDHELGGHVILHELKLIVEMRPGDIIFIPSAVVTHETMPIGPDETRQSIALYTAGGVFRNADAGFQSYGSWEKTNKAEYDQHMKEGEKRWMEGWNLFDKYKEPKPSAA